MTAAQASFIDDTFTVVTSVDTTNTLHPALGTGFDAVVWQIKVGEVPGLVGFKALVSDASTTGNELLTELDGVTGVNRHSLRGHMGGRLRPTIG